MAIGVGLQAGIQGGTVTGIEESSVRALTKLVQVMPTRLRRRIDALAAMTIPATWDDNPPSVDADILTAVAQTCRDCERLEFTYTARDDERSERLVDPHRLVLLGRRWYLVAWDLSRIDWRTFRLDRMTDTQATGGSLPRARVTGWQRRRFRPGLYRQSLGDSPGRSPDSRAGRTGAPADRAVGDRRSGRR